MSQYATEEPQFNVVYGFRRDSLVIEAILSSDEEAKRAAEEIGKKFTRVFGNNPAPTVKMTMDDVKAELLKDLCSPFKAFIVKE